MTFIFNETSEKCNYFFSFPLLRDLPYHTQQNKVKQSVTLYSPKNRQKEYVDIYRTDIKTQIQREHKDRESK